MEIREFEVEDYKEVISLWRNVEGIGLHEDCDSRERVAMYLGRNPGLSFVAKADGKVVGAVLCGHDSRRGYLQHLAVAKDYRREGVGRGLVERVTERLRMLGIRKCHIFVFADNVDGYKFWESIGWCEQTDLKVASRDIVL